MPIHCRIVISGRSRLRKGNHWRDGESAPKTSATRIARSSVEFLSCAAAHNTKSFRGLSALVRNKIHHDLLSGSYLFSSTGARPRSRCCTSAAPAITRGLSA